MTKKNIKTSPRHVPIALRRFIRNVGQFIEYWGFMRLQGEIWALVFLSRKPLTANEVAGLLGVSKASVSLAMKELIDYQVLYLDNKTGKRNLPLIANENIKEVIVGVLKLRECPMIQQTRSGVSALRGPHRTGLQVDETRLRKVEELISTAESLLQTLVAMHE